MSKITYTDKVTMNENPNVADVNKVKASDMNEIKQVVNENAETLTNLQDQLLDKIYPIGSYYETSNTSFDPNVTWGGTWVNDSKGRVTVALDDRDADFNTISKTGGSKYLQQHEHSKITGLYKYEYSYGFDGQVYKTAQKLEDITVESGKVSDVTTGNSGNLQPYIVVVRWHRIA